MIMTHHYPTLHYLTITQSTSITHHAHLAGKWGDVPEIKEELRCQVYTFHKGCIKFTKENKGEFCDHQKCSGIFKLVYNAGERIDMKKISFRTGRLREE